MRTVLRAGRPRILGNLGVVAALGLLAFAGCSDDETSPTTPNNPGGSNSITMTGAAVSGTANSALTVVINSATLAAPLRTRLAYKTVVTASGTLTPVGGSPVALSGTYDTDTDALMLTGSGYDLVGQADTTGSNDAILGGWDGPGGPGLFGCAQGTSSSPVTTICGTYMSDTSTEPDGNFDILITGSECAGIAFPADGSPFQTFEGTVGDGTGTSKTLELVGTEGTYTLNVGGTWDTATNDVSGWWGLYDTSTDPPTLLDSGTFEGGSCH
jgi:hypothetical protein